MELYKKYLNLTLSENKTIVNLPEETKDSVLKILEIANKELSKVYNGKYKFQLSYINEKNPDELKLTPKKKRRIKEKWLEFNSELSKIHRKYESFLQHGLQNDIDNL